MVDEIDAALRAKREAAAQGERIRVPARPAPRPSRLSLALNRERAAAADGQVQALRDKLRAVGLTRPPSSGAPQAQEAAHGPGAVGGQRAKEADGAASPTGPGPTPRRSSAERGEDQHARLAGLESGAVTWRGWPICSPGFVTPWWRRSGPETGD